MHNLSVNRTLREKPRKVRLPPTLGATMKHIAFLTLIVLATTAGATELTEPRVLSITQQHFAKECTPSLPCSYKATKKFDGWEVFVEFTKRNSPTERPVGYPGGHSTVVLNNQGKIVNVMPGE